jgi:Na+/melibiose symporter-like transporter
VLCFVSGVVVQGTLHRLVLEHVFARADLFPAMILLENVLTLAAVPLWLRVSDRLGKHRAVALAALWIGALSLPLPFFQADQALGFVALMVLRGSSFASILFLGSSMAADAVDSDTLATGQQRTGLYFGVYGMVIKGSLALGVVLATSLPSAFGFDPGLTAPSDFARLALMGLYAWLPGVLMAAGGLCLWSFPLTREAQARLRAELVRRSSS